MSPESFKSGGIWRVMVRINGSLQAIELALLVLFFLSGVVKTSANLLKEEQMENINEFMKMVKTEIISYLPDSET